MSHVPVARSINEVFHPLHNTYRIKIEVHYALTTYLYIILYSSSCPLGSVESTEATRSLNLGLSSARCWACARVMFQVLRSWATTSELVLAGGSRPGWCLCR